MNTPTNVTRTGAGPGSASDGHPMIFRASGPNRNAVILECLRLLRTHACRVRTLAGKVFDRSEFSLVAEVIGHHQDRERLAGEWEAVFPHETSKTGPKRMYAPVSTATLGTHFVKASGTGEDVPVDVLDLVSGELNAAINVAYVRRVSPEVQHGVRYTVELVVDLRPGRPTQAFIEVLGKWGCGPCRRLRVVALNGSPDDPAPVSARAGPRAPSSPLQPMSAAVVIEAGSKQEWNVPINFPGGVDWV